MDREDQSALHRSPAQVWSALVVALVIGLALHITLNVLGLALGLVAVGATPGQLVHAQTLPWSAGLWWLFSVLASLFAAGLIVGRLSLPRRTGDALILAALVWASTALAGAWIASTTVGRAISGVTSIIVSSTDVPTQRVALDITVTHEQSLGSHGRGGMNVAENRVPTRRSEPAVTGRDALRALSWMAIVEAARQLRDPEVRATIRRMTENLWEDTAQSRLRFENALRTWLDGGTEPEGTAADALRDLLATTLLIDRDTASQLMRSWSKQLAASDKGPADATKQESAGGTQERDVRDGFAQSPRTVRGWMSIERKLSQAFQESLSVLKAVIAEGGTLSPRRREKALNTLKDGFQTSRTAAERILKDWEQRTRTALGALEEAFAESANRTAKAVEVGLDVLAIASGWVAVALGLGFLVTTLGAFVGGQTFSPKCTAGK